MDKLKLKDSYSLYLDKYKDCVEYKDYSEINKLFMKFIIENILNGDKVYLPARMGSIQVKGKIQEYKVEDGVIKGLAPDWRATKEYRLNNPDSKKVIYHTNTHTDNVRYKIRWSRFNVIYRNKTYYTLRFTRNVKRSLAALIKEGKIKYEVL